MPQQQIKGFDKKPNYNREVQSNGRTDQDLGYGLETYVTGANAFGLGGVLLNAEIILQKTWYWVVLIVPFLTV